MTTTSGDGSPNVTGKPPVGRADADGVANWGPTSRPGVTVGRTLGRT